MMEILPIWIIATILIPHVGIGWTLLLSPGNMLDWLAPEIMKIKQSRIRDLLLCPKCCAGQLALWNMLWVLWRTGQWNWIGVGLMWVLFVIVVTDQLNTRYGYS